MRHSLSLLLPALIPSWRFFETIEASPRVQWCVLDAPHDAAIWQDYRPRPARISAWVMMRRMIWNPWWNEALHMVSLAERLLDDPSTYPLRAILEKLKIDAPDAPFIQFRILLVTDTSHEVAYLSAPHPVADIAR